MGDVGKTSTKERREEESEEKEERKNFCRKSCGQSSANSPSQYFENQCHCVSVSINCNYRIFAI